MILTTLVYLFRDNDVLLAMKKRGFGVGWWNGVGGKVQPDETIVEAAAREAKEEIGVDVYDLKEGAVLEFHVPEPGGEKHIRCHVFTTTSWDGEPVETEEMRPQWFAKDTLPLETMWASDRYWVPKFFAGEPITLQFQFNEAKEVVRVDNLEI